MFKTSEASDIYSLALVLFSAWSHNAPFVEYPSEYAAGAAARRGLRPTRPLDSDQVLEEAPFKFMTMQRFWELLEEMWAHAISGRPHALYVEARMNALFGPIRRSQVCPRAFLSGQMGLHYQCIRYRMDDIRDWVR